LKRTCLIEACETGRENVVAALLSKGANLNLTNVNGFSALHLAVDKGFLTIVKMLVEAGADLSIQDDADETPLDWAVRKESETC
jgi:uncharacterized protein